MPKRGRRDDDVCEPDIEIDNSNSVSTPLSKKKLPTIVPFVPLIAIDPSDTTCVSVCEFGEVVRDHWEKRRNFKTTNHHTILDDSMVDFAVSGLLLLLPNHRCTKDEGEEEEEKQKHSPGTLDLAQCIRKVRRRKRGPTTAAVAATRRANHGRPGEATGLSFNTPPSDGVSPVYAFYPDTLHCGMGRHMEHSDGECARIRTYMNSIRHATQKLQRQIEFARGPFP